MHQRQNVKLTNILTCLQTPTNKCHTNHRMCHRCNKPSFWQSKSGPSHGAPSPVQMHPTFKPKSSLFQFPNASNLQAQVQSKFIQTLRTSPVYSKFQIHPTFNPTYSPNASNLQAQVQSKLIQPSSPSPVQTHPVFKPTPNPYSSNANPSPQVSIPSQKSIHSGPRTPVKKWRNNEPLSPNGYNDDLNNLLSWQLHIN